MSRFIAAFTFIAACVAISAAMAQSVPQPTQPQYNPAQPPQYNPNAPAQPNTAQPQYNPAQYNPAQMVNPQLQQQLTPEQQRQLEQMRQAQLQQRPAQPQYDPRFQPAQYQPPVNPAQPGQLQPGQPQSGQPQPTGLVPGGMTGQPITQPGMQPLQLQPARAPFQLTPQQESELDMTLKSWETTSAAVKTFEAEISRWEYDPVWVPNGAKTESAGKVKFQAPDKGLFEITSAKNFNTQTNKFEPAADKSQLEHWVCDGTYVYVVDHKEKKVSKNELPPNMRGTQIADGPLPFVFGQKADKLKARYWVRITTPANVKDQIWLEAVPKYQADAANYKKVDIILDAKQMHPMAIQTHNPDPKSNARTVYEFRGQKANGIWANFLTDFIQPPIPSGYKLIDEPYRDPSAQPPQQKPLQATAPGPLKK